MRKKLILVFTALALLVPACKTIQYVPIETGTSVHVVDSVAIHYLDSIRIYEATRYRDFAWMNDTLKLRGNRSRAWAVADTLKGCLIGEIEEDAVEEHTKVLWKDKLVFKDSIRTEQVPVPVEVERVVAPKLYPWSLALNVLFIILTILSIYLKFRKH